MDQTDFAIAMVSGVLIIIAIFLFIIVKIFGKNKKVKLNDMVFPDLNKIEPYEFQPVIEIKGEQKEDKSSIEFYKTIGPLSETAQIPKEIKEEHMKGPIEPIKEISLSQIVIQSIEDNEKLKLEDILIEIRDENTKKKARTKRPSGKNLKKVDKLKEKETPEKKPKKRPGKKVSTKKKTQAIENENPGSGEL